MRSIVHEELRDRQRVSYRITAKKPRIHPQGFRSICGGPGFLAVGRIALGCSIGKAVVGVRARGLVALGFGLAALWRLQDSVIYQPGRGLPGSAEVLGAAARDVTLATSDGLELGAWYVPSPGGCDSTVLFAHGNGGNRGRRTELVREVNALGYAVLVFDYRGYGGNAGRPRQAGLARDARAARSYLVDELGVPAESIVYFGESLGTAVVTELASEHPPAAMLLRSPFTTLPDVGRRLVGVPIGWLLRDRYPTRDRMSWLSQVPIGVVYGHGDRLVPPRLSRAVARSAAEAGHPVFEAEVTCAGHDDPVLMDGPAVLESLDRVARLGGVRPCPGS